MTPVATRSRFLLAVLALSVLAAGCIVIPLPSSSAEYSVTLSGLEEVPPVTTKGGGTLTASLHKTTNVLTWKLSYAGLTGPVTAAHFHGPAPAGQNAGVVVGLANPVISPSTGEATLTAEQAADVLAGKWYLNVHTAKHPGGEIRGQLVAR